MKCPVKEKISNFKNKISNFEKKISEKKSNFLSYETPRVPIGSLKACKFIYISEELYYILSPRNPFCLETNFFSKSQFTHHRTLKPN